MTTAVLTVPTKKFFKDIIKIYPERHMYLKGQWKS